MTEAAAMQHLRRVRARKEQAAGQPKFRVVLTARDYHWWETTYERLLRPTVRESRVVTTRAKTAPPPPPVKHLCMDCQEDITGLEHHQKRKRCEPCQIKFLGSTSARERKTDLQRAYRASLKKAVPRFCACGTDIRDRHGAAFRCRECSALTRSYGLGALDDITPKDAERPEHRILKQIEGIFTKAKGENRP